MTVGVPLYNSILPFSSFKNRKKVQLVSTYLEQLIVSGVLVVEFCLFFIGVCAVGPQLYS